MGLQKEFFEESPDVSLPDGRMLSGPGPEKTFRLPGGVTESSETDHVLSEPRLLAENDIIRLGFRSQPKPSFSPTVLQKLAGMRTSPPEAEKLAVLIEEMAKTVVDFYHVRTGQAIAVRFDGRIVESADTEIELLIKIQGKRFGDSVFVWQVGSESFSGWRV